MFSRKKSYSFKTSSAKETINLERYNATNHEDIRTPSGSILQETDPIIFRPFLGLFYACIYAIFNQFVSVIVKKLFYINPCQLTLVRHIGIFVAILPLAIYRTDKILGERKYRFILFLRALFGATGIYCQFIAYSYLPLAEASIIMSTMPLVTAVTERIVLKETYGLIQSICLIMTICGVLLTVKLPELLLNRDGLHFDFTYIVGLVAAVGNVLLLSLSYVYVRKLKSIDYSVILLYLGIFGTIENSVINAIFIPFVSTKCGWDQVLCILLGAFGFISNCSVTFAVYVEPAGLAAVQKSSFDILIIIIFQIIFFNIYPDVYVICGACLVLAALTIEGIKDWILLMPETSKINNFNCLK